jgi:plastocyanin
MGPVRLIGVSRFLSNPYQSGSVQVALGGGGTIRLTSHVALAGDVVSLTDRDPTRGEEVAWSAGLHLAIPNSPHTFSLQATNTNTATLQGASRGADRVRYGFEFVIPITLARYFGKHSTPAAAAPAATAPASGNEVKMMMKDLAFTPGRLEIAAGTTVAWTNNDQLPHSVSTDDGAFDSGLLAAGAVWRHTFDTPGTYTYHCTPHPFMKGVVVVK